VCLMTAPSLPASVPCEASTPRPKCELEKEASDICKSELRIFPVEESADRARVILTASHAREIFKLKDRHGFVSLHAASVRLAFKYGVSAKAIRDIWSGRSWLRATYELWNEDERPEQKVIGRPKGRKDSRPRAKAPRSIEMIENLQMNDANCGPRIADYINSKFGVSTEQLLQQEACNRVAHTTLPSFFANYSFPLPTIRDYSNFADARGPHHPFNLCHYAPMIQPPLPAPPASLLPSLPEQLQQLFSSTRMAPAIEYHAHADSPILSALARLASGNSGPDDHGRLLALSRAGPAGPFLY
jgi:hypothetical protein